MLLQQFTRSLTQELTKLHAYEQESCLAGGEDAHPSFASRCRCPLHHPRKQGASGAWLLLDLLPKAFGVSWCVPASQTSKGLHLCCGLLQLALKPFRLIRSCQAVTSAGLQAQQPWSLSGLGSSTAAALPAATALPPAQAGC